MDDPADDIDEVALNVLLAEGLDLPTALAASRRDSDSAEPGCGLALLWIAALPWLLAAIAFCVDCGNMVN